MHHMDALGGGGSGVRQRIGWGSRRWGYRGGRVGGIAEVGAVDVVESGMTRIGVVCVGDDAFRLGATGLWWGAAGLVDTCAASAGTGS